MKYNESNILLVQGCPASCLRKKQVKSENISSKKQAQNKILHWSITFGLHTLAQEQSHINPSIQVCTQLKFQPTDLT